MIGIIALVIISLFLLSVINEFRKTRIQKDNVYRIFGVNRSDVKCDHKFLVVYGLDTPANTICTVIMHKDYLFIILPTINYKISKEQLIGASMFTNDELIEKRNTESLAEHLLGNAVYGIQTEAVLDALRPATKMVNFKRNFMVINFNPKQGEAESIVLAPETNKDNNFIRMAVGAFNVVYKTKPMPINSQAPNSQVISSETVDL